MLHVVVITNFSTEQIAVFVNPYEEAEAELVAQREAEIAKVANVIVTVIY